MFNRSFRFALRCGAAVSALAVATTAQAQDAPDDRSSGVEEIVVTAQFRAQNLQDTPLAITAVSGEILEARNQTSLDQVADQAPSVTLKPQAGIYGNSMAAQIRGVGQFDYNPALEPGVGVYIDDVYFATLPGSIFDLLDVDRVEILRGPQGTLAGRNSIGGAVKLYSQRPTGDGSGYVQGTYGSRDRIELRSSFDIGLAEGVALRLAGVGKWQDGYVKRLDYGCLNPTSGVPRILASETDCLLGREGGVGTQAFRGQLRIEPTSDLEINISADYTHEDHTVAGEVLTAITFAGAADINPFPTPITFDQSFICGPYCNYATYSQGADGSRPNSIVDTRTRYDGWGMAANIEWRLTDSINVTSITGYRAYDAHFPTDADLSPLAHSLGVTDLDFWSFSQELRLGGSIGDVIDWTVGGFYMDQRSLAYSYQDLRYSPLATFQQNDPVNADTVAAFGHVTLRATDRLTLIGGIRYTDEHKDYTFVRLLPDGITPSATYNGEVGTYDHNRVDYRVAAQYALADDIMAYAQYSTGFKGGGVNPRPFKVEQIRSFTPETLTSYEIGLKTDLFDRRVRFNLAAFHSKYDDIQLTLSTCPQFGGPGPCALVTNAGDGTINGIELETAIRPLRGLMIDAAVSYLDFKYDTINPAAGGPTLPAGPQMGDRPPYVPEWKWSLGAQHEVDLQNGGSLTPRIDLTYQGTVFSNAANRLTNAIESYTLANARLTYRAPDEDYEISLQVTNLFDEYYYLTNRDQTLGSGGISTSQPGRPREWAVTLTRRF